MEKLTSTKIDSELSAVRIQRNYLLREERKRSNSVLNLTGDTQKTVSEIIQIKSQQKAISDYEPTLKKAQVRAFREENPSSYSGGGGCGGGRGC